MLYERLQTLCEERAEKITPVLEGLGIATSATGRWKKGTLPTGDKLILLADYFNVSIDFLLGRTNERIKSTEHEIAEHKQLSEQEEELIDGYRKLNPRMKHDIMTMIYSEADKAERIGDGRKRAGTA